MLYLAQLRGRTGGADEDFFTVKSWVFESEDDSLAEGFWPEDRAVLGGRPGLAERVAAALKASGWSSEFYVVVEQVEQVEAAVEPTETLTWLADAELRRNFGGEEKAEPEISELDPSWQKPLPIPGIRE